MRALSEALQIARETGLSPSTVLLRWSIENGVVAIPASSKRPHIRENALSLNARLSPEQVERLSALQEEEEVRFCWNPHQVA